MFLSKVYLALLVTVLGTSYVTTTPLTAESADFAEFQTFTMESLGKLQKQIQMLAQQSARSEMRSRWFSEDVAAAPIQQYQQAPGAGGGYGVNPYYGQPMYNPMPPQGGYIPQALYGGAPERPPIVKTLDGLYTWGINGLEAVTGHIPPPSLKS